MPVTVVGITAREFIGTDNDQPSMYLVIDQREQVFPDSAFLRSWETETTGTVWPPQGRRHAGRPRARACAR